LGTMKCVIQRVKHASVTVQDRKIAGIDSGVLTLLGIEKGDTELELKKMIQKIVELRIFEDEHGKMNRSLIDVAGAHMIISQFTLAADCTSGRRPSFTTAEVPEAARALYDKALQVSEGFGVRTCGGAFGADMKVELLNDGPVTFILDSKLI